MGKIKKIIENELVGGIESTDIYPITSIKAVYDENDKSLDVILSDIKTVYDENDKSLDVILSDIKTDIYSDTIRQSFEYTVAEDTKQLGKTIPKYSTITLEGDVLEVVAKTNLDDSAYQTIVSGTVANRDINFVRAANGALGSLTISYPSILENIQEIRTNLTKLIELSQLSN